MSNDDTDGNGNAPKHRKGEIIFKSALHEMVTGLQIPDISLTQILFTALDNIYDDVKDNIWMMDIIKETSYKFSDIKPLSTKFASALTRMGFKKGDVLYFVTYDSALIYILLIGTWLCGGVTRGCFQGEEKEEYKRQMIESSAHFVLCDTETVASVKGATEELEWPVHLLSIDGKIEGTTPVEEMIENDDGAAFPYNVKINSKEDVLAIPTTSGSTGFPKGAMHTHYNFVALLTSLNNSKTQKIEKRIGKTTLTTMGNFGGATLASLCWSILYGSSYYFLSRFEPVKFIDHVLKYKPSTLSIYPYYASCLARSPELDNHDFSFIKNIICVGSVFDLTTAKLLSRKFPLIKLSQVFAMSEILMAASSEAVSETVYDKEGTVAGLKYKKLGEESYVSSGILLPLVEAKIRDPELGCTVGPNRKGNLWIRVPYVMKGYLDSNSTNGYTPKVDGEGWFDTGDLAAIDETNHLYVIERSKFIFKYNAYKVSPTEIEAVIGEHPAVLSVGVVAVPDPLTTSAAKAFIVLKPGHQATEADIKQFVAERKEFYKHLHGGVEFIDSLPVNRGGKLDRVALLKRATTNKN